MKLIKLYILIEIIDLGVNEFGHPLLGRIEIGQEYKCS